MIAPTDTARITEPFEPPPIVTPWRLEIADPMQTVTRVLRVGQELTIGSGKGIGVRVEDASVSARHLLLHATEEGLKVRDLDSTNGLYVGALRVSNAVLRGPHCTLVIGRTSICASPWSESDADTPETSIEGLIGRSTEMRRLCRDIRRFAPLRATVLLQGESGTGKDVVARAMHRLSSRGGQFVALNVGGLSENMADAELFGYCKGAYTGALQSRRGVFEDANAGTLFLDEVADLHPAIQVKLLRVLEDQKVRPLGTNDAVKVDTRVVCASWIELEEQIRQGEFRADLYHRISTIRLEIPPLRKRKSDIGVLAEHWLRRYEAELGPKQLTGAALARLFGYEWPGNVRELGSVLYRAALDAMELQLIDASHIERALPKSVVKRKKSFSSRDARRLLEENEGNISAAARAARVPRTTFRAWLKRAGLEGVEAA